MSFLETLHRVVDWCVGFSGRVFVLFAVIAIVLVLIEMLVYAAAKKPKTGHKKRVALITGASSGLGREYAKRLDRTERGLDEIWLVARRADRLNALAGELGCGTHVLPLDLTKPESLTALKTALRESDVEVAVLINCAGLGKIGNYAKLSLADSDNMIEVNDRAAVDVTVTALPFMGPGGRILEICSTAAFQPLQHFNVYAASKIFLYHYTRALRMELLPRHIRVTAVCPYWMRDTEFIPIAKAAEAKGEKPAIKNFAFGVPADRVARRSLRTNRLGMAVSTPGLFCTIHRFFSKLLPREVLLYFWELLRRL